MKSFAPFLAGTTPDLTPRFRLEQYLYRLGVRSGTPLCIKGLDVQALSLKPLTLIDYEYRVKLRLACSKFQLDMRAFCSFFISQNQQN